MIVSTDWFIGTHFKIVELYKFIYLLRAVLIPSTSHLHNQGLLTPIYKGVGIGEASFGLLFLLLTGKRMIQVWGVGGRGGSIAMCGRPFCSRASLWNQMRCTSIHCCFFLNFLLLLP